MKYVEEFSVPGLANMGIEDTKKRKNRFMLWYGGCRVGHATTIAAARSALHRYAQSVLEDKRKDLVSKLTVVSKSQGLLAGYDAFCLGAFKVIP